MKSYLPHINITTPLAAELSAVEVAGMLEHIKLVGQPAYFGNGVGGSIHNGPIFHNGAVYFGACDKMFYALTESGKEKWRFLAEGQVIGWPSVSGGRIFFGSFDRNVYCLGADGSLIWKFPTNGKVISTPLIKDDVVYFGSEDQNVYAVDAGGKLLWKFATNGFISSSPVPYGENMLIGSYDKNLYCLDKKGGLVWKFPTSSLIPTDVAVYGDTIFLPTWDGVLYALEGNGRPRVMWRAESKTRLGFYYPLVAEGKVFIGSRDGVVRAYDLAGSLLWEFRTMEMAAFRPAFHACRFREENTPKLKLREVLSALAWRVDASR